MVLVVGVLVGGDVRVRNGIEHAASEDRQGASEAARGGVLGQRLLVDSQRRLERGRRMLLDDGAALARERIADSVEVERRSVHLDFIPYTARHGIFMTLPARGRVEERTQSGFGREDAVEDRPATAESIELLRSQARDRIAGVRGLGAAACDEAEQKEEAHRSSHRAPTLSMRSATSCLPDQWHCTRTMSPRFSALSGAPAGASRAVVGTAT